MKNPTRINPPKFRVGRYKINEYELRQLMLEVAQGRRDEDIIVRDEKNNKSTILSNGKLSNTLYRFDVGMQITMKHYRFLKSKL